MGLKHSYTLFAPLYDLLIAGASEAIRAENLQPLHVGQDKEILLMGIGSGLDIPHLPAGHRYTGIDLAPVSCIAREQQATRGCLRQTAEDRLAAWG